MELNIPIMGFNTKGDIFGGKLDILASVRGESLIKYPLETKSNGEGKGVVTSALVTPGRRLGVEVCSTITPKKRCCYCKVHRRRETLSLLSEAPALKRKWVGDGKWESGTNVTMKGTQRRCLKISFGGKGGDKRRIRKERISGYGK